MDRKEASEVLREVAEHLQMAQDGNLNSWDVTPYTVHAICAIQEVQRWLEETT